MKQLRKVDKKPVKPVKPAKSAKTTPAKKYEAKVGEVVAYFDGQKRYRIGRVVGVDGQTVTVRSLDGELDLRMRDIYEVKGETSGISRSELFDKLKRLLAATTPDTRAIDEAIAVLEVDDEDGPQVTRVDRIRQLFDEYYYMSPKGLEPEQYKAKKEAAWKKVQEAAGIGTTEEPVEEPTPRKEANKMKKVSKKMESTTESSAKKAKKPAKVETPKVTGGAFDTRLKCVSMDDRLAKLEEIVGDGKSPAFHFKRTTLYASVAKEIGIKVGSVIEIVITNPNQTE